MNLYKYLRPEFSTVLRSRRLRFSQPAVFNDPFDGRPAMDRLSDSPDDAPAVINAIERALPAIWNTIDPGLHRGFTAAAFLARLKADPTRLERILACSGAGWVQEFCESLYQDTNRDFGVLSLTADPSHPLMWGHYAQCHKGFVIGFDGDHPWFDQRQSPDDPFNHAHEVIYATSRPVIAMLGLNAAAGIFTKSEAWSYEQEWRLVRHLDEADEIMPDNPYPIHLFTFPAEMLREVRLGFLITPQIRNAIIATINATPEYQRVEVYQADLSPTKYELDFKKVVLDVGCRR